MHDAQLNSISRDPIGVCGGVNSLLWKLTRVVNQAFGIFFALVLVRVHAYFINYAAIVLIMHSFACGQINLDIICA